MSTLNFGSISIIDYALSGVVVSFFVVLSSTQYVRLSDYLYGLCIAIASAHAEVIVYRLANQNS